MPEPRQTQTAAHADSLVELLAAQCADLESLLALARCETDAAERRDFEELLRITTERATLGERLEVHQRLIADLRAKLGGDADLPPTGRERVALVTRLAVDVQAQDARTRPLLYAAREELTAEAQRLHRGRRGSDAYLRDARAAGAVACDEHV